MGSQKKVSRASEATQTGTLEADIPLKTCEQCPHWREVRHKVRLARLLSQASDRLQKRLADKSFEPSLADYLKLLQLEKDIREDEPKEIKVTWVDPPWISKPEE